jgi:hypothetical protein
MRIRIQLINFDADPYPDFYLMRTDPVVDPGYQNNADPDPQHWKRGFGRKAGH